MRRHLVASLLLVLSASILTACGSSDAKEESASTSQGAVQVTWAALSVSGAAPIVLGEKKGIFKDNGIDLKIEFVEAPAVVPGVLSGKYDFGQLNAPAVLAARANNVPVTSVATIATSNGDPADFPIQIVVPTGSDISSPSDLVGKKVATDTLYQLPDFGMRAALLDSNVDPADLHIVEIPFAEMGAALKAGKVDAAVVTEPFGTILRKAGAVRDLLSTSIGQPEGSPQAVILSSEKFVNENKDVVAKFQKAVDETLDYAVAHDAELRATLPTYTKLDAALAGEIRFAPIGNNDSLEGWQAWADILTKTGVIKKKVDVKAAYVPFG